MTPVKLSRRKGSSSAGSEQELGSWKPLSVHAQKLLTKRRASIVNDPRRPVFVVRLRGNGRDDIRELRRILKILLRGFGLRCVGISQEQVPRNDYGGRFSARGFPWCARKCLSRRLSQFGQRAVPRRLDKELTRNVTAAEAFVARRDRPEYENGIYVALATVKPGDSRPIRESCFQFTALFADVDDKNHDLSREVAQSLLEQCELPPTLIIDSGNGLHPYWLLLAPCDDADRIEAARRKLQDLTASDAVHDAARVMRLPNTHNSKRGQWQEAKVVYHDPQARYKLET